MPELLIDKPAKVNFVERLNKAISACKVQARNTIEKQDKMLRVYASGYFNKGNPATEHPMNMIDRAVSILLPYLVGNDPKIWIEPKYEMKYKPFADTVEKALNKLIKQIKLTMRTLEPAVLNSLFSIGITKTGTKRVDTKEFGGEIVEIGEPFCEIVDRVRYVYDITAESREQYEFEGDSYYLPTKFAKEFFGSKFADKITPDFKLYGDKDPKEIVNTEHVSYNEIHDYTEFYDIWLPRERTIITILPAYKSFNRILRTADYDGLETGPYDTLCYKTFPNTTIPIPPIYSLMELDAATNTLYSKARSQAERLKKIAIGESGSDKDAQVVKDASDGDYLLLQNPNTTKEVTLGGVVPEIYNFLNFTMAQFSEQGGNLNTAGGRSSGADTLGQEEMLMSNAGRFLNMMSQKVHQFSASITEKLLNELLKNPTKQIPVSKKATDTIILNDMYNMYEIPPNFEYELDIDMFSMQPLTPEQRYQKGMQLLSGLVLPTLQQSASQGLQLNVQTIIKDFSKYIGLNTDSWFKSAMPTQSEIQMGSYQPAGKFSGVTDNRLGSNPASNMNNMNNMTVSNNAQTQKRKGII